MSAKHIDAAVTFLRRWHPSTTRVLTAIAPDEGFIRTRGFAPGEESAMADFLGEWEGRRGCFFQVNTDLRSAASIEKKGRKEHIGAAVALQVDIDTYKDEGRNRDEAVRLLTEDLPEGVPGPASVINSSGNGIQAFWRLVPPFEVNGDRALAAEVESRNRFLASAYGGDTTVDVSRIMRVPWVVNLPNERKRALGLEPTLARQLHFDMDQVYALGDFPAVVSREEPAEGAPIPDAIARRADAMQIGPGVAVADVFDLIHLSARTQARIVIGTYPGEERRKDDGSLDRSAELFAVIVAMIRAGEANEVILGVVTDPRWRISESVLEKADPDDYARRQIRRAHAWLSAQIAEDFHE